ncbi:transporter substrate-binding domain-containing protein [Pseudomonas sp. PDM16]|uniref:substrate-binding periplasmic protein n=1 Tax=Pseudomonas sp. PDM16 TaxID=2769292 RepID=UPI0017853264|nr:transporter substrate-binding domain-containing protein [Pseudomonas sp. PDM16]MBD9414520.1 transporter substrate-binding domain-containing protein [Pseudomonas sp. PDM16]
MFRSSVALARPGLSSIRWLLLASLLLSGSSALAERVVRVGTGDWVPYVDQHREDGGALVRLVKAVFTAAGYQVEFVFYPWDRNVLMLQQGMLDAIMPYSCSPIRLDYGVCSEPLVRGQVVLFHRKDLPFDWTRVEDLKDYRIGTTLGYSYGPEFDGALNKGLLRIEQNSKEDTAFRLLELKRIDLHPQDRAVGYSMLRRLFPGEQGITHHPRYLNTEPLRLLFRKGDPAADELLHRFNEELSRFAQRGELKRLQEALYSGDADRWRPKL